MENLTMHKRNFCITFRKSVFQTGRFSVAFSLILVCFSRFCLQKVRSLNMSYLLDITANILEPTSRIELLTY